MVYFSVYLSFGRHPFGIPRKDYNFPKFDFKFKTKRCNINIPFIYFLRGKLSCASWRMSKPSPSASKGQQQSLFSFFKKPATSNNASPSTTASPAPAPPALPPPPPAVTAPPKTVSTPQKQSSSAGLAKSGPASAAPGSELVGKRIEVYPCDESMWLRITLD
jgi:hypothetical protein